MMSWLSLLLHEKEDAEISAVERTPSDEQDNVGAGLPQQTRVRASLDGIAEDLVATSAATSSLGSMRLEVRDRFGTCLGQLEPAAKPGRYILACQGESLLDIEALHDRSMALSKHGEALAAARILGSRRNPELPELTGEEEEHLQVDIREGTDSSDTVLLLTCALSLIVFKPKANQNTDEDVDVEVCKSHETAETGEGIDTIIAVSADHASSIRGADESRVRSSIVGGAFLNS
jgi:hypothetical protein